MLHKKKSAGPSLNCNPTQQGQEQQGEDRGCPSAQVMWKDWTPTLTHSEKEWCIINIMVWAWLFWRALVAQQSQSSHYGQLCFTVTCCSSLHLIRAYRFTSEFVHVHYIRDHRGSHSSPCFFESPPVDEFHRKLRLQRGYWLLCSKYLSKSLNVHLSECLHTARVTEETPFPWNLEFYEASTAKNATGKTRRAEGWEMCRYTHNAQSTMT